MKSFVFILSLILSACLIPSIGAAEDAASSSSAYIAPIANESARAELVSFSAGGPKLHAEQWKR